jgi:peptide/nickel transport system substrate-binding protein
MRDEESGQSLTRRRLLGDAGVGALTLAAGGLLTACGGGAGQTTSQSPTAAGRVQRGGTLRVGLVGGGKAESFNPGTASTFIDVARLLNTYDQLTRLSGNGFVPGLAVEWNPNRDATVYEVKLRRDVSWHDGKPFTTDDVIYTLRQMGRPTHLGKNSTKSIDLHGLKRIDAHTLRVPLKVPNRVLPMTLSAYQSVVVQDGTKDYSEPVGTGPFKVTSFEPGQRSMSARFADYWDAGKPYVDALQLVSIDDDGARLNALLAGDVDAVAGLTFTQAKAQAAQGGIRVFQAEGANPLMFLMRVDTAPFDDNRVRQAMRLLADRQALVDDALLGFGAVGNDLVGKGLRYFADDLPAQRQDVEKATSLLKAAGREDLRVTLRTSPIAPGTVEAATLFAAQARAAGVSIRVQRVEPSSYFDPSLYYLKLAFGQSFWIVTTLSRFYNDALTTGAPFNETHLRRATYDKLIAQADGARGARAQELWHEAQQIQYDEGGYLVWAQPKLLDGLSSPVQGIRPSGFVNLGTYDFKTAWLSRR